MRRLTIIACTLWSLSAFAGAPNDTAAPDAKMAQRASAALKAALRLPTPSVAEVGALIRNEQFLEFETRVQEAEKRSAQDPLWESPLYKLFGAIDGGDPTLKDKLDLWVKTRPGYISLTARGTYEEDLGYKQRGTRYIKNTPPENLKLMDASMSEAHADLEDALASNPKFVPAYVALLEVAQAVGGVEAATVIEKRSTEAVPATYIVRYTYLMNLRPRWGGTYEEMQAYEDSLTAAARLNPRIWSLKAQNWAELGYSAREEGDGHMAILYYSKALQFGDRLEFLKVRATLYMDAHQYDLAAGDFNRYREYFLGDDEVNQALEYATNQAARCPCPGDFATPGAAGGVAQPPPH